MPNSYSKDSSTPGGPEGVTEPISQVEGTEHSPQVGSEQAAISDDATEVLTLANGYEYVTAESGNRRAVIDTEDDSLTLGLMRNGEEFEKLTRRERRAERAAALSQAQADEALRRVALQSNTSDRDYLAPVVPLAQEPAKRQLGSKVFFVGSAALTAAAAVVAVALLLPGRGGAPQPASGASAVPSTSSSPTPSSVTSAPASTSPAPVPSFNTQLPTITEQQVPAEAPVIPGTVQYATDPAPQEAPSEAVMPAPVITVEPTPVVTEATSPEAEPTPTETEAEPTETAAKPTEEPTEVAASAPVESSAPTVESSAPTVEPPATDPAPPTESLAPSEEASLAVKETATPAPPALPVQTPASPVSPSGGTTVIPAD